MFSAIVFPSESLLIRERGGPESVRSDNEREFTSRRVQGCSTSPQRCPNHDPDIFVTHKHQYSGGKSSYERLERGQVICFLESPKLVAKCPEEQ